MIRLKIDNKTVEVEEGTYLHKAALKAGVEIPIMCWYEGMDHFTSCMVCMVKERESGRLLPSCSVMAKAGMDIITSDSEVLEARKTALELLLSEHVGDCEAPCRITCPAGMDIPRMNRLLAEGNFAEALEVVREDIALPSVLGRICPAPCEGACRRKPMDGPVAICLLKRFAGDHILNNEILYKPVMEPENGLKVAITGAGPAGLSAAYYLRRRGYRCDLYESAGIAGGAIRSNVPQDILPKDILDTEIRIIESMGVNFILNHKIETPEFKKLLDSYDAVIIACLLEEKDIIARGLEFSGTGIKVEKGSYQTSIDKVFAVGSALRPSKLAIRSLGQGKEAAFSVDQLLHNQVVAGEPTLFNSRFGKLVAEEYAEYIKESVSSERLAPAGGLQTGYTKEEVMEEASRCLRCDCRGKDTCLLRIYSGSMGASQKHFASDERRNIRKIIQHDFVIYEPAKCIKCGRCVRITSLQSEKFGFTFIGRGFEVEIGIPFDEELSDALTSTAEEVVRACPTGALERRRL